MPVYPALALIFAAYLVLHAITVRLARRDSRHDLRYKAAFVANFGLAFGGMLTVGLLGTPGDTPHTAPQQHIAAQIAARYGVHVDPHQVSDLPVDRGDSAHGILLPVDGSDRACTVTLLAAPVVTCADDRELPRAGGR